MPQGERFHPCMIWIIGEAVAGPLMWVRRIQKEMNERRGKTDRVQVDQEPGQAALFRYRASFASCPSLFLAPVGRGKRRDFRMGQRIEGAIEEQGVARSSKILSGNPSQHVSCLFSCSCCCCCSRCCVGMSLFAFFVILRTA